MAVQGAALALPFIKSLEDCGDFAKTVLPFAHQLQELPLKLLDAGISAGALKQVYLETNPLITAFAFALAITPIFLIVSEVNRNYSQVDRCWSLLPTIYLAHYDAWAHLSDLPTRRLDNLLAFGVVWSLRLTYNYWRKGGYNIGSEDYRWEIVKAKVHPALFFIFNVVFISLIQSVLLFLVATPAYNLLLATAIKGNEMAWSDVAWARFLMLLVVFEWFADQQQWDYHQAKAAYKKTAKVPPNYKQVDLDRGFCATGLWAWSRHPNFAAEQAIWVVVYQWSCYATDSFWNWTGLGALSYLMLFQGSTWLTELISAGKYPDYAEYQEKVGKFLPNAIRPPMSESAVAARSKDPQGKKQIGQGATKTAK